jgi:hypothetical protein
MVSFSRCSEGTVAMLDFQQFSTETDYDYVNIYNGANSQADRICPESGEICELSGALEDMSSTHIESTTNQISIEFQSDESLGADAGGPPATSIAPLFVAYCMPAS